MRSRSQDSGGYKLMVEIRLILLGPRNASSTMVKTVTMGLLGRTQACTGGLWVDSSFMLDL